MSSHIEHIEIVEKPDWVTWDEIKQCLILSHSANLTRGFDMVKYKWSIEKIQESIGENSVVLVALDGRKVVGTAAVGVKYRTSWYINGYYAYMSLAGVLPEYSGHGLYKRLIHCREEIAKSSGCSVFLLDTHEKNRKIRNIAQANGYRLIGFFRVNKHHNVLMAKWPAGCPYSVFYCRFRLCLSWIRAHLSTIYHMLKGDIYK